VLSSTAAGVMSWISPVQAVSATASQVTSSSGLADVTSMTLTAPATGTYLVEFSSQTTIATLAAVAEYVVLVNGVAQTASLRSTTAAVAGQQSSIQLMASVSATAGQAIKVQFRRSAGAGNVTVTNRTLSLMRIN
jgi:hypothetical protein